MPQTKPTKPYAEFPLTPHPNGQFVKKIRGKIHYFGSDADQALERYFAVRDDLHAGRTPTRRGRVTTERLVFAFLDQKQTRVDVGDLSPRTLADYKGLCQAADGRRRRIQSAFESI